MNKGVIGSTPSDAETMHESIPGNRYVPPPRWGVARLSRHRVQGQTIPTKSRRLLSSLSQVGFVFVV